MSGLLRRALLLGVIGLAGCSAPGQSAGPPWVLAASPDMIVLRWYPDEVSDAQALQVANGHCAATRRGAVVQASEQSGSVRNVTYRCQ